MAYMEPEMAVVPGGRGIQISMFVEHELAVFRIVPDGVAADESAREDFLRQRIFELRPDRAFQWTRTVDGIKAEVAEQFA